MIIQANLKEASTRKHVRISHPRRPMCERCENKVGWNAHHVTYNPEKIAYLCPACHQEITEINTKAGFEQGSKLTNQQREDLFDNFMRL